MLVLGTFGAAVDARAQETPVADPPVEATPVAEPSPNKTTVSAPTEEAASNAPTEEAASNTPTEEAASNTSTVEEAASNTSTAEEASGSTSTAEEASGSTSTAEEGSAEESTLNKTSDADAPVDKKPSKKKEGFVATWWNGRTLTETASMEYVGDNGTGDREAVYGDDDNFWVFNNVLFAQARNRTLDTSARLNMTFFHQPPALVNPPESFVPGGSGYTLLDYDNDVRLERLSATLHTGVVHTTVGDFPLTLGRGMALSLIRLDGTTVDNALRGGRVRVESPGKWRFAAGAGWVNGVNKDPITRAIQRDDPLDLVIAGEASGRLHETTRVFGHGVYIRPRYTSIEQIDPTRLWVDRGPGIAIGLGGGGVDVNWKRVSLYLEGNAQLHDNYRVAIGEPVLSEPGQGAYGAVSVDFSKRERAVNAVLTTDGIFYRKWLMEGPYRGSHPKVLGPAIPYHSMPTLEPAWMLIRSLGNGQGGRLRLDSFVKSTQTDVRLSAHAIEYLGGLTPTGSWDDFGNMWIAHGILNVTQSLADSVVSLDAIGGYRSEWTRDAAPGHDDKGFLWHASLEATFALGGPHSVSAKQEVRQHHTGVTETIDADGYWVAVSTLGYDIASQFGVAAIYEYTDEVLARNSEPPRIWGQVMPLQGGHYGWLQAKYQFTGGLQGLSLAAMGGTKRGGLKCAGGVCAIEPDFVGTKAELTYRY